MDKKAKKPSYIKGGINHYDSRPAYVAPEVENVPYQLCNDSSRVYNYRASRSFHDVMVNDKSVLHHGNIEEVRIWPNGWGYVLMQKWNEGDELIILPDGRKLNYTLYGWIQLL